jgi:hypothetical protein
MLATLAVGSSVAPGAKADAVDIAANYVKDNKQALGLTGSDVNDMQVTNTVVSSDTATTHVYFQQVHKGIGVYNGAITVSVAADGWVISAGNRFVSNLAAAAGGQAKKKANEAAEAAARHVGLAPKELRVVEESSGPSKKSKVSAGGVAAAPIGAELVWHPLDAGGVRLAWNVEIDENGGEHFWSINVDAETGAVLATDDFVDHDTADSIAAGIARPAAGAGASGPATASTAADGSSYNVFALPFESPSDGGRSVVHNPADANASPFGWHDTNGADGPEFTRTRGNNVHAYADRDNNNVPDPGTDPDGGAGLDFDFPLNLGLRPLDYRDAAVTNLFY